LGETRLPIAWVRIGYGVRRDMALREIIALQALGKRPPIDIATAAPI